MFSRTTDHSRLGRLWATVSEREQVASDHSKSDGKRLHQLKIYISCPLTAAAI